MGEDNPLGPYLLHARLQQAGPLATVEPPLCPVQDLAYTDRSQPRVTRDRTCDHRCDRRSPREGHRIRCRFQARLRGDPVLC